MQPVGHDPNEEPLCLSGATPTWKSLGEVKLDVVEPLNGENDGLKPEYYYCNNTCVDRHSCTYMNIDDNDTPDVICTTGAGGGEGFGYTEIYLTDDSGRLVKAPPDHGLQTKTTLSTRVIGKLRSAVDNSTLIFIGTNGQKRADGKTNKHQVGLKCWVDNALMLLGAKRSRIFVMFTDVQACIYKFSVF